MGLGRRREPESVAPSGRCLGAYANVLGRSVFRFF